MLRENTVTLSIGVGGFGGLYCGVHWLLNPWWQRLVSIMFNEKEMAKPRTNSRWMHFSQRWFGHNIWTFNKKDRIISDPAYAF